MNQDQVNAVWLMGLVVFLLALFRSELSSFFRNLRSGQNPAPSAPSLVLSEQEDRDLSYRMGMVAGTMGGTIQSKQGGFAE